MHDRVAQADLQQIRYMLVGTSDRHRMLAFGHFQTEVIPHDVVQTAMGKLIDGGLHNGRQIAFHHREWFSL
ncbi:hypothetical protein CAL13_05605 [Bordetella genomosp. 9]|uniref:Uncharacterized protein n=1 Tax=Bordetella genomosp. 9 TaxID=1416803 RepID=A0A1W6YXF0_9BORD|nr:hypothetical protein CAL13_05605 [Bordetella genomosp. 9]ARP89715.1 hypothetical protein CAL14_04980 [Bordetella genomosp. 9]